MAAQASRPASPHAVASQRMRTQRLAGVGFSAPADVVRWSGAVQAQDFPGALWALGLRTAGATEASVEQAIADRQIVRSWPLRGTLHFTTPEDLRWMLQHFAPRIATRAALHFRQLGLDARAFARAEAAIVRGLEGGRQLSRPRLYALFERAGITTGGGRGAHVLWKMAHQGLICFGVREAKQHTFALLEEWAPQTRRLSRDEALAELAQRYFASHGPATLQDFTWWSGLSASDARRATEATRPAALHLAPHTRAPRASSARGAAAHSPHVVLLPPYDEYTVAYIDRRAALDPKHAAAARNGISSPIIVVDGRIVGTWTRRVERDAVVIDLKPFARPTGQAARGIAAAAARYGRFLGLPARVL